MIDSRRRLLRASRSLKDLQPGDMVRRIGHRGTGLIESIDDDHATAAWNRDRRDILPLAALRLVRAGGSQFDRRGER